MKVAAAQLAPVFSDVESNTLTVIETIERLRQDGVDLIVFPEAFLSGYCYESLDEALRFALPSQSPIFTEIARSCVDCYAIVGYSEIDGDRLYNTAVVLGEGRVMGSYRKTHLPYLGMDRFATPGERLPIFDLNGVKVGIGICFDVRFPELARCYALAGVDILCLPTNWPQFAEPTSNLICPTRAMENHIFVIAADRVGEERGVHFCGHSKIIDPKGRILASADHAEEALIVAEIDALSARNKNIVVQSGEYELSLFDRRNPALYGEIAKMKEGSPAEAADPS